jgi:putative transposase
MPDYRRLRIADGCYFFTVNLGDRRSCLLTDRVGDLRHAVRRVRALAPFRIDAWVVLAHHMHAIEASVRRGRGRRALAGHWLTVP